MIVVQLGTFEWFPLWGCYESWCYAQSHTSLCRHICFHFSKVDTSCHIAGSYSKFTFAFVRSGGALLHLGLGLLTYTFYRWRNRLRLARWLAQSLLRLLSIGLKSQVCFSLTLQYAPLTLVPQLPLKWITSTQFHFPFLINVVIPIHSFKESGWCQMLGFWESTFAL